MNFAANHYNFLILSSGKGLVENGNKMVSFIRRKVIISAFEWIVMLSSPKGYQILFLSKIDCISYVDERLGTTFIESLMST